MSTPLDQIDVTGGISVPNFFNGRILSAEDMRQWQGAERSHRRLLGRSIGPGVAAGLHVTRLSATTVRVSSGVGINRLGETIELPLDTEVRLAGTAAVAEPATSSGPVFADCGGTSGGSNASNAFLLTVRPDSVEAGSAPADPYLTGQSCGPGHVTEGVRFRRIGIDPTYLAAVLDLSGTANLGSASALSRNIVSHLFLGSRRWEIFGDVTTASGTQPDLEAAQDLVGLQGCEVPLALFYLQGGTVTQLDEWSVRRPCRPAGDDATGLGGFVSSMRAAAGEATFRQFQAQLTDLLGGSSSDPPRAGVHFRHLPAAGILPGTAIGSPATLAAFRTSATLPFFQALSSVAWRRSERTIDSARVESVIRDGCRHAPVDLVSTRGLPLTVVPVRESLSSGRPYAVFVSATHPYRDRIDLDGVIDRIAALEPEIDDEPYVTVVSQDVRPVRSFDGHAVRVQFRITTNTAGEYVLDPVASSRLANRADPEATVASGEAVQSLPEGSTVVEVRYFIALTETNGGLLREKRRPLSDDTERGRSDEEFEASEGDQPSKSLKLPYLLGLEVALESDPEVRARASVGYRPS
ncbi:hypothetical protein [Nocardioides gilvus]|uniref:hypothetical protein n=1 Tax=Nocardioides gilvus TaxID=1735589 RepID=UPI000D740BCE|nr:hypothetical protein [Nocardioides gilvus]